MEGSAAIVPPAECLFAGLELAVEIAQSKLNDRPHATSLVLGMKDRSMEFFFVPGVEAGRDDIEVAAEQHALFGANESRGPLSECIEPFEFAWKIIVVGILAIRAVERREVDRIAIGSDSRTYQPGAVFGLAR